MTDNFDKVINWYDGAVSFVDGISSSNATPGGGAAGAVSAATGVALAMMACSVTIKIKTVSEDVKKDLNKRLDELLVYKETLCEAASLDAKAYESVVRAKKLPSMSKEKQTALKEAVENSARVPRDTAFKALEALALIESFESQIAAVILSDIACAKHLLKAGVCICAENIKANLPYIEEGSFKNEMEDALKNISKFC